MTTDSILGLKVLGVKSVYIVEVTPDDARRLLGNNYEYNRNQMRTVIEKYASDMKSGHWDPYTNEPLGFNGTGVLLDGQHRLEAVILAGIPVLLPIMTGISNHYGVGARRRAEQLMKMVFHKIMSSGTVAFMRCMLKSNGVYRPSEWDLMEYYNRHLDAVRFAESLTGINVKGVTTAAFYGVMARAYYHENTDRLRQFADVMKTGLVQDTAADIAAHLLREQLMRGFKTTDVGGSLQMEIHYRTERAIKAFCAREHITKLYKANSELYPVPGEKAYKDRATTTALPVYSN